MLDLTPGKANQANLRLWPVVDQVADVTRILIFVAVLVVVIVCLGTGPAGLATIGTGPPHVPSQLLPQHHLAPTHPQPRFRTLLPEFFEVHLVKFVRLVVACTFFLRVPPHFRVQIDVLAA